MKSGLLLSAALLAGCSARPPLVADYGPERAFELGKGTWFPAAALGDAARNGHFSDLGNADIVGIQPGAHDVLRFSRKDDDCEICAWVELDGATVVDAAFWAREWNGETTWVTAVHGKGTCTLDAASPTAGTLDLRFDGKSETPRDGATPRSIRLSGPFRAERTDPR